MMDFSKLKQCNSETLRVYTNEFFEKKKGSTFKITDYDNEGIKHILVPRSYEPKILRLARSMVVRATSEEFLGNWKKCLATGSIEGGMLWRFIIRYAD